MQLNVTVISFPDGSSKWMRKGTDVSDVITEWKESLSEKRLKQLAQCAFTVGEVIMPESDFNNLPNNQRVRESIIIQ